VLGYGDLRARRPVSLFSPGAHLRDYLVSDDVSSISILTLTDSVLDPLASMDTLETSPAHFLERLSRLDDELVVVDLPPAGSGFWLDVFLQSDIPVVVTGPESWSVRSALSFYEVALARCKAVMSSPSLFRSYIVVNRCREASERDLGEVLCHAFWRKLGHYPRYLGPLDNDDRRWFHLRHGEPAPPFTGSGGLSAQLEALARRLVGLDDFDDSHPRSEPDPVPARETAEFLGLSTEAPLDDLRGQYRRLWEGYRRDSAISRVVLDAEVRSEIIGELERTYRALQMAADRARRSGRAIRTAEGESDSTAAAGVGTAPEASGVDEHSTREAVPRSSQAPASASPPEGEPVTHCGALIRRARQEREMSRRELSLRTRIGLRYLEAIETFEVEALPPPVYLRGYLREIARVLDHPVDSLLDRYLSELAAVEA
jgi:hypothetical protein